jgi:toxin-antitoxin system PIN domain toxin
VTFAADANLLVHASNTGCAEYARASRFLARCADGPELLCLTWATITAYLRSSTHPAVFRRPLAPAEAAANIEGLLALPHVRVLVEDERFWAGYRDTASAHNARGNGVPDAHLAALLRHHGVETLYTRDRDFLRFWFLNVIDPLETAVRERRRR